VNYWLMKSEPDTYGIEQLAAADNRTTCWDGVRNYQARNMMRDDMRLGDRVFFYHSSCPEPGVVGIARVSREAYPDPTATDPNDPHYDPKSDPDDPRWFMVDITLVRKFKRKVTLKTLREYAGNELADLALLRRGNRLSVMPVSAAAWEFIVSLAKK
jgi:predicted RNA-binding protein with PUA-like domain